MNDLRSSTKMLRNQAPSASTQSQLFDNCINEWLSTKEAAAYLRITVGSLHNMSSNGLIPYYKLGKRNRYRLEDLRKTLIDSKKGNF